MYLQKAKQTTLCTINSLVSKMFMLNCKYTVKLDFELKCVQLHIQLKCVKLLQSHTILMFIRSVQRGECMHVNNAANVSHIPIEQCSSVIGAAFHFFAYRMTS